MKDQRLKVFRAALEELTESLDALVRVTRWSEPEAPPDPLRVAVSRLVQRLGAADRLASGVFVGSPADVEKVKAMCAMMKRLDVAYITYRKRIESKPQEVVDAAATLGTDIAEATAGAA